MGNSQSTAGGVPTASPLAPGCPMSEEAKAKVVVDSSQSGCPVQHSDGDKKPLVCTSDELDPKNLMFVENQKPAPGQKSQLPVDRQTSSIPQAGASRHWVYPSPQMFYNAMLKKGWQPREEDMETVVAIHNNVNEKTWHKIMSWESLHPHTSSAVQLVRFCGRPTDLTPKARFRTLLGHEPPFDRHDWIVDRGGKEVRYVIDFYAHDPGHGLPPITVIDARPALDDLNSVLDRFRMRYYILRQRYFPIDKTAPSDSATNDQPSPAQ